MSIFRSASLLFVSCVSLACAAQQVVRTSAEADRDLRHATVEWANMAPHLPDPQTGSAAQLQVAADVLRARRMPEDALEYYQYALARGGDASTLWNRIGITELELREVQAAKVAFKRAVSLKKKDSEGWNNMGAAEYVTGNYLAAIQDYQRAVRFNEKSAVFHSNLGTAYFETKDYETAGHEFELALKLDPAIFQHSGAGGVQAHVLSPADRGRFCFSLAKLAAKQHNDPAVIEWLSKASETGYDILFEMRGDAALAPYLQDERVVLMVKNAKLMRNGQIASAQPVSAMAEEKRN